MIGVVEQGRIRGEKFLIFTLAFVVRALLAYIFYGSVDVTAFIGINRHTLQGTLVLHPFSIWCAFPVIPFYLWLSGFLAIVTPLPVAFCFKLIPVVFDSLIAIVIFDIMRCFYKRKASLYVGLSYALSPVALLIVCIHGQWESVPVFFLVLGFCFREFCQPSLISHLLFGICFALSFLMKPMALVLLPFFFVPYRGIKDELGILWNILIGFIGIIGVLICAAFLLAKTNNDFWLLFLSNIRAFIGEYGFIFCIFFLIVVLMACLLISWKNFSRQFLIYLARQSASFFGLLVTTLVCFGLLTWYGFDMFVVIDKIFRYFNQGITVFGLPFANPFNKPPLILILKNRFWIMGLILGTSWGYYCNKISLFDAICISFASIFSFSGLSPQYLLWLAVFLPLAGRFLLCTIYTVVVTLFMLLFYMHPLGNPVVPNQNMMSFAALRDWAWFMPTPWFASHFWIPIIALVGNYILPITCMFLGFVIVFDSFRKKKQYRQPKQIVEPLRSFVGYLFFPIALSAIIALCMVLFASSDMAYLLDRIINLSWQLYDHGRQGGAYIANYAHGSRCNIIVAFIFFLISSCWFVLRILSFTREQ